MLASRSRSRLACSGIGFCHYPWIPPFFVTSLRGQGFQVIARASVQSWGSSCSHRGKIARRIRLLRLRSFSLDDGPTGLDEFSGGHKFVRLRAHIPNAPAAAVLWLGTAEHIRNDSRAESLAISDARYSPLIEFGEGCERAPIPAFRSTGSLLEGKTAPRHRRVLQTYSRSFSFSDSIVNCAISPLAIW